MANSTDEVNELREESKVITKELIEAAVRSKEGNSDINVKDYRVKTGSSKGENYGSVPFAVDVTTECNDEEKVHHLFIKTMHNNPYLKELSTKCKIFYKEGMAYSQIVPDMIKYQTEHGMEPFGPSVPPFYYSVADDSQGIIILENIGTQGYVLADRRKGLNYEQCKFVMKELAVFHSLSFAVKGENPENMKKYENLLYDTLFQTSVPSFFKTALKSSVELVKRMSDDPKIKESVENVYPEDIDNAFKKLLEPVEPYALICHGDMWCNNMLFKYEEGLENVKPIDVKLLDLQVVRYALPTTDLAYFFYTSTTKATRDQHLNELLRLYHSTFVDCLKKLNLQFPEFTISTLEKLFKETAMFGIMMAGMVLPGILTKPENADTFTGSTEAEVEEYAIKFYTQMAVNKDNASIIKTRLVGAIEDAVEMGLI